MGSKGGGGTVNTSTQETSTASPVAWMQTLSRQLAEQQGQKSWNQSMGMADQIGANAGNWANQSNAAMNSGLGELNKASNMAGSAANLAYDSTIYDPNRMQQDFMNPYTANVVQSNADIAQRNFNQQTAPSLMAQMGASGQFGSSRANNAMALAASNMAGNLANTNADLMNKGYQQEQNAYLDSMKIGVSGANAMNGSAQNMVGAGGGMGNIGSGLWNSANQANSMGADNFAKYAGGLSYLPIEKQQKSMGNKTEPAQGAGF